MANVKSWAELSDTFKKRAQDMEPAVQRAVASHAEKVFEKSQALLQSEIYDDPIDNYGYSLRDFSHKSGLLPKSARRAWTGDPAQAGNVFAHSHARENRWTASKAYAERKQRGGSHYREGEGRPKWERTGLLGASETMRIGRMVAYIENAAGYALHRHDLGLAPGNTEAFVGSTRKSRRIAPWRKRAMNWFEPQRLEHYSRLVGDVLDK